MIMTEKIDPICCKLIEIWGIKLFTNSVNSMSKTANIQEYGVPFVSKLSFVAYCGSGYYYGWGIRRN